MRRQAPESERGPYDPTIRPTGATGAGNLVAQCFAQEVACSFDDVHFVRQVAATSV